MSERASIVIGDVEYKNWVSYEVESDLLTPADAFSFEVGSLTPDRLLLAYPGQKVTVKVGSELLIVGRLDEASVRYSARDLSLQVTGRDQAAALVDCSVKTEWNFYSMSLEAVAKKVLAYYGIAASVDASDGAKEKISQVKAQPGETAWEFLDRYARRQEVLMWFRPDGTFALQAPNEGSSELTFGYFLNTPVGTNILEGDVRWNIAERFSQVTVLGQEADFEGETSQPTATQTDSEIEGLGLFRPLVIVDSEAENTQAADRRARWERDRRRADGLTLTYTVRGHQQDGRLIVPNKIALVMDERCGISGSYLITAARYSCSKDSGPRTRVTLRRKGALLGLPDAENGSSSEETGSSSLDGLVVRV